MFFGREKELKRSPNMPPRRTIFCWAASRGKNVHYKTWNACARRRFRPLFAVVLSLLTGRISFRRWRATRPGFREPAGAPGSFSEILQALPVGKPLIILLDEADRLIRASAGGYPLFNVSRDGKFGSLPLQYYQGANPRAGTQKCQLALYNFGNDADWTSGISCR
jgi:hypothetical protein